MPEPSTKSSRGTRTVLLALPAFLAAATVAGCAGESPPATASVEGQAIYERYCAVCHGPDGNGEGPASYLIFPKPRNFARGQFKLRSTPMGLLPTDDDLDPFGCGSAS